MKRTMMQKELNQEVADRLNRMNLSNHAAEVVATTDLSSMEYLFGDCDTESKVEERVDELEKTSGQRFYIYLMDEDVPVAEAETYNEAEKRVHLMYTQEELEIHDGYEIIEG